MKVKFTRRQRLLIKRFLNERKSKTRVNLVKVFAAIAYLVKTGCQWAMLPTYYPKSSTVYYHYRCWTEKDSFAPLLKQLVKDKRAAKGRLRMPSVAIIDSQSVRSAYAQSQKGIDGHKRVNGIKRQIAVDSLGYPLSIVTTTANVSDQKGEQTLLERVESQYKTIAIVKSDHGYHGTKTCIELQCVKSNFGTSDFVPLDGRWVVRRPFSWLESIRGLCRNYEHYLLTARSMAYIA